MEDILYQTLSTNANKRKNAAHLLEQYETENYLNYATAICSVIANNQLQDSVRMSAGLALKNSLAKAQIFGGILADQRSQHVIKTNILPLLATESRNVANVISQVVATMATIDIQLGKADGILSLLANNITQRHQPSHVKQVALQTIGYICESMQPELLSTNQKDLLLTAIIDGSRREQLDVHVKLTAIRALYNSLEFIKSNFENNIERDFVMKVICDAATPSTCSTIDLQVAAYECLNKVVSLYYDKMDDYMTSTLYNLTLNGMTLASEQSIVLLCIEFWSTVCEIEINRKKENTMPLFSFAEKLIIFILPTLLKLLIKDKDNLSVDNDDEWDTPKAAANCVSLLALCCRELVVPPLIHFIEKNLFISDNLDWNQKEAAIVAFGSILDGPSKPKMKPLVQQILPTVLACMKCPNVLVRLAASRTLTEIIKESSHILNDGMTLASVVSAITFAICDTNQKVSHSACLAITQCAEKLKASPGFPINTGPLSVYSYDILKCLLDISTTFDLRDDTFMQAIYEAISTIVKYSKKDCDAVIQFVTEKIISRLEILYLAETQIPDTFSAKDVILLQSSLLGVLQSCIYRLSEKISLYLTPIMRLFFSTIKLSQKECHGLMSVLVEDVYLIASAMIVSVGPEFECFVEQLIPHIPSLMRSSFASGSLSNQDCRLCLIGVGIMSDLSCTLPKTIRLHASLFIQLLLSNLSDENTHRDVKPASISCLGDVAHALGPDFYPYINTVMMVLQQAGNMQANQNNTAMIAYVDAIRVSIIEAFVGILQGLGQDEFTRTAFLSHVHGFMLFVNSLVKDNTRSDLLNQAILGLLGDIARIYGDTIQKSTLDSVLCDLTIENLKGGIYFSSRTKEIAQWAQKMILS